MRRAACVALTVVALGSATAPAGGGARPVLPEVVQAQKLRGLESQRPLVVRRIDRAGFERVLDRLIDAEVRAGRSFQPAYDDLYRLLGVIGPEQRLQEIMRPALRAGVAGLYDPRADTLYLLRSSAGRVPPSVIVHEAVHALQDQYFTIDRGAFAWRPGDADAMAAVQALVEGDATEVGARYVAGLGLFGALREAGDAVTLLRDGGGYDLPIYFDRSLLWPYLEGEAFVAALRRRGGSAAVDAAFRRPPRTTLAILDPQRYLSGDVAAAPAPLPRPRAGARRVLATTWGAAEIDNLTGTRSLALSWRGGRVAVDLVSGKPVLRIHVVSTRPLALARAFRCTLPRGARVSVSGMHVRVDSARAGRVTRPRC